MSFEMKNVLFIGGIHGVGKGTICQKICNEYKLIHLSASEVLRWEEISTKESKMVKDFELSQNRLITNLNQIIVKTEKYVLDGHYCLLNYDNKPKKIDYDTFYLLNPFAFIVVVDNVLDIKQRLEKRDKKEYDLELLIQFQELEIDYSVELSKKLGIPHFIVNSNEINNLINFLHYENFT